MTLEEMIESIQKRMEHEDNFTEEKNMLGMAEAALADLINYYSDGPCSRNIEICIKEWK